jgi:antitoxin YefM
MVRGRRRLPTASRPLPSVGEARDAGGPRGSRWLLRGSDQRARILYMTTIPLSDARARLSELVDEAVRTHERVDITRNGRRAAVLLSADDFDSLMETLDILADPQLMQELAEADEQIARGEVYTLEEVEAEMRARGRLPG